MLQSKTDTNLIDVLRPAARAFARQLKANHSGNFPGFENWNHDAPDDKVFVTEGWASSDEIEYRLNGHCFVRLTGIKVKSPEAKDIYVSPIEMTGDTKLVRANAMSTMNRSPDDIEREVTITDHMSTIDEVANEIGAEMELGLRQQVGYGSEAMGIQGETEVSLRIAAAYKRAWSNSVTREWTLESTRNFKERAWCKTSLDRIEESGPAQQIIKASGLVDFGCYAESSGRFAHGWKKRSDLEANMKGIHTNDSWNIDFYRQHSFKTSGNPIFADYHATVERVRKFEHATKIDANVVSEPLNNEAELKMAYEFIETHVSEEDRLEAARKLVDSHMSDEDRMKTALECIAKQGEGKLQRMAQKRLEM